MDINSIDGSNPYTTAQSTPPPVDNTLLNNKETQETEPPPETSRTAPQAFEVNITQEAQDRLAAESTPPPEEPQSVGPEQNPAEQSPAAEQNPTPPHEANQIVNIVA